MINLIGISSDIGNITLNALEAIQKSDIIINFDELDLSDLRPYIRNKKIITTIVEEEKEDDDEVISIEIKDWDEEDSPEEDLSSNEEEEESEESFDDIELKDPFYLRLKESYSKIEFAIRASKGNQNVAIITSSNPSINGIANLLIQMCSKYDGVEVKIYPGVSPIDYSASVLGAPLEDFAVIDLNNPLVSDSELEAKIDYAIKNNLLLVVYNPINEFDNNNKNFNLLKDIVSEFNDELLVGIVNSNSSRVICKFKEINELIISENSVLIIGNKLTYKIGDCMVTSSDYIVEPKFISHNIDFFKRYLNGEVPRGLDMECEYLPCHKELEACDFCYCPFYPCADGVTGGEWIKGREIWNCTNCIWIHLDKPCACIREEFDDMFENIEDLKTKHIELLKLRRKCLLETK